MSLSIIATITNQYTNITGETVNSVSWKYNDTSNVLTVNINGKQWKIPMSVEQVVDGRKGWHLYKKAFSNPNNATPIETRVTPAYASKTPIKPVSKSNPFPNLVKWMVTAFRGKDLTTLGDTPVKDIANVAFKKGWCPVDTPFHVIGLALIKANAVLGNSTDILLSKDGKHFHAGGLKVALSEYTNAGTNQDDSFPWFDSKTVTGAIDTLMQRSVLPNRKVI